MIINKDAGYTNLSLTPVRALRAVMQTFATAWILLASTALMAAGPLAIQNATIITGTGDVIEQGTILIRDGRIAEVGVEVEVPVEAKVIEGQGKVVMPGFIDAHNAAGMSQANERNEVVPFLTVVDSIDPIADYFEECRRNGITTAAVVPGNSTLIGGKAAIVKTAGQYVNDMLVKRDSAMKLSLVPTSGSRMSQMVKLRKELDAAQQALKDAGKDDEGDASAKEGESTDSEQPAGQSGNATDKDGESDGDGADDEEDGSNDEDADQDADEATKEEKSEGMLAMMQVVAGEMPVYIYCQTAMDVATAIKLTEEYGLDSIYVLGQDCYKAAKLLEGTQRPVILDPALVFWKTDPRTREDEKITLPPIYHQLGISFVFQTENSSRRTSLGRSYLWYQAATAIKYGVPESEALRALCALPAKLLGIDDIVGTIATGKDADLVILSGHPLEIDTWVEQTIIAGEVVYRRDQDEKLQRLLSPAVE